MVSRTRMPAEPARALLWDALLDAGLIAGSDERAAFRGAWAADASARLAAFESLAGHGDWRAANAVLPRPYAPADLERMITIGAQLTEFACAAVPLAPTAREPVVQLGSLANVIVAVYDQFADLTGTHVLRRDAVRHARSAPGRVRLRLERSARPPETRVMSRLVAGWHASLTALARAHGRDDLCREITDLVVRMYDVERATSGAARLAVDDELLRAKAALPFVVMGLPAWLSAPQVDADELRWHRAWLGRLGEFFGWIDDVVDIDEDRAAGEPNLAERALALGELDERGLALHVAGLGLDVVAEWTAHARTAGQVGEPSAGAVRVAVASWLGEVRLPA